MKNKRPLAPGFINRLDEYLLKNKPDTWSARAHLVLYYGLSFIVVLTVLCFIVPDDPRKSSNVYVWGFLTGVLSFIGFIVWLIYLLRFNVFKRFGIVSPGDKLKTFIFYFVSVGIMVGAVYVPTFVEKTRANAAYPDKVVIQDINNMNLAICRLNYDSVKHSWDADTFLVRNSKDKYADYYVDSFANGHRSNITIIDTANFAIRKMESDSIVKMNDSLYILYKCPDYNFVRGGFYGSKVDVDEFGIVPGILTSPDIYNNVLRKRETFDKAGTAQQLAQLLRKYNARSNLNDSLQNAIDIVDGVDYDRSERNYIGHINTKYRLSAVDMSLYNIEYRKHGLGVNAPQRILRMLYYTTLLLTLLVFIFRQSTIKTFFLSIVAGVLLLILTVLLLLFISKNTSTNETSVLMICYVLYIIIFFVLAIIINYSKTRSMVLGIGLNLFSFFIVFLPLIAIVLYYQLLKDADRLKDGYLFNLNRYPKEDLHYFYAEILGAVLLLILIETVLKRFYRKWYSLPEA